MRANWPVVWRSALTEPLFTPILLCLLALTFSPLQAHGEDISLDGSWQYSTNQPGDSEATTAFNQRYGLGWNSRITKAISFDANVNYSRNVSTGNIIRETLSPTASLQIDNDIFMAEINGMLNQNNNSISYNQRDRNWEGTLGSTWDYEYWPSLSLSIGQSWLADDELVHVTDASRQWSEFTSEWEGYDFGLYYSYYQQLRIDDVEQSSYDEKTHFGRLDYSHSFLDNTVNVSFSGQLTDSITEATITATNGDFNIAVTPSQGVAGVDPVPTAGALPSAPALIDGNQNGVVISIRLHEVTSIGIKTDMQTVDTLYVYTGPIEPPQLPETASLGWNLYSSEDGINWILEMTSPSTVYDADKFRYQVSLNSLQRIYLKLVATAWPSTLSVPITEIEAFRQESGSGSGSNFSENQQYKRGLTDFNIRYTPTLATQLNYSMVWDNAEYTSGNNRARLFQTGGVKWQYSTYFIPSFTINNTATTNSSLADTNQLSYAFTLQSTPLPTLDANLSITRNENMSDGELETTNHIVNLHVTAALYPQLDSTLDISTNLNNNELTNSSDENLALRWTVTARLRPGLLVDFIAEHNSAGLGFSDLVDFTESGGRATLNVNWRPSELLSILVNGSKGYGEQWSNFQTFLFNGNVSLIRTAKTQLTTGYIITATETEVIHVINGNWSWNISEFLTMQTIANYLIKEKNNSWFVNARLTTRF